jgi:glycerophosphoryl diester phosphodiesterase
MKAIAHRGCMDDYPENTVGAFRGAAPKADAVECDVRRCRSGELVVFHDETLDRATDGTGRVDETDWSELRERRVHGTDERIPRLEAVLEAVPADTTVTVELKSEGLAADVVERIARVDNDVIVSSFHWDELRAARRAGASTLAVLCYENPDGALSLATELDCAYVHPPKELCIGTDLVERAHDRGMEVNVWTAETREDVDELRAAGVDGLSTDSVDIVEYVSRVGENGTGCAIR